MRILIDTHIFLWIFIEPNRFSEAAQEFFKVSSGNEFYISYVTAWETAIKFGLGKLRLPESPDKFVPERIRRAGFSWLPVEAQHCLSVYNLPQIHKDPFDRLLISQAIAEDLTVLTADPHFKKYKIKTIDFKVLSK